MNHLPTLVILFVLSISSTSLALSSCVAFDINWNLLAFGFDGKDYNAGTQDSWASGTAADITASGRPPFTGSNVSCYLSQFDNAIYVLGADSSSLSSIHIYDATAKSWSTQATTTGSYDPSNAVGILDHDTNVFYSLSNGELFSLDMSDQTAAKSSALSWTDVQAPSFTTTDYKPVMALAQNHIHFLDVPGTPAGSANIFVIHFSFFQPATQAYGDFPATHGQATSFFLDSGVQQEFAFIPDDGSATYVINVETNTTQTLAGPSTKDANANYFASTSALVQLSESGSVSFLAYNPNSTSANAAATWGTVANLPKGTSSSSSASASGSATGKATGTSADSSATGSSSGSAQGAAQTGTDSGASGTRVLVGMGGAIVLATVALLL